MAATIKPTKVRNSMRSPHFGHTRKSANPIRWLPVTHKDALPRNKHALRHTLYHMIPPIPPCEICECGGQSTYWKLRPF